MDNVATTNDANLLCNTKKYTYFVQFTMSAVWCDKKGLVIKMNLNEIFNFFLSKMSYKITDKNTIKSNADFLYGIIYKCFRKVVISQCIFLTACAIIDMIMRKISKHFLVILHSIGYYIYLF